MSTLCRKRPLPRLSTFPSQTAPENTGMALAANDRWQDHVDFARPELPLEYSYHLALEAREPLFAIVGQHKCGTVEVMLVGLRKADAEIAKSELCDKYPGMKIMIRDLRWEIVLWPGRMAKSPRDNKTPRV